MTTEHNGAKTPGAKPVHAPPDVGSKRPIEILEARIERPEAAIEGLQDTIHRDAVLTEQRLDEFDRRTEVAVLDGADL